MGKLTGKMVKGVLKAFGKEDGKASRYISDEMDDTHKAMIKSIQAKRAKEIPDTTDVENIVAPSKAVENIEAEVRPDFMNMNKAQKQEWVNKAREPNDMFPEGIPVQQKVAPEPPVELPEGEDEAINTIMELIKSSKNKAKAKK